MDLTNSLQAECQSCNLGQDGDLDEEEAWVQLLRDQQSVSEIAHKEQVLLMDHSAPLHAPHDLTLRDVIEDDLAIFFEQQLDPDANYMAAFTRKDPTDRLAFIAHWNRSITDPTDIIKTILVAEQIGGYVTSYEEAGEPEVSYWLGKDHWGKGLATRALLDFLAHVNMTRPIHARVAKDNYGSLRVLQKAGFTITGENIGFANARGREIAEFLLTRHAR